MRSFWLGLLLCALLAAPAAALWPFQKKAPVFETERNLVLFGDSLLTGEGDTEGAIATRLQQQLRQEGYNVRVTAAAGAGDTTAAALSRLPDVLAQKPDFILVAFGTGDMERAVSIIVTRQNMDVLLGRIAAEKIPILLAGAQSFRNMQGEFGGGYQEMYKELAVKYHAVLHPFFLEHVALDMKYTKDGLHPNADGARLIADNILPEVKTLLAKRPVEK